MKLKKSCLVFLFLFCYLFAIHDNNSGYESEIFNCPPSLKVNVEFWEKIFSEYRIDQIVIHDRYHINIIYEVIDLKKEFNGKKFTTKQKTNTIKKYKKKYENILKKLGKYKGTGDNLSADEYKVFNLFKGINKRDKFYSARKDIRTQQGLKEKFIEGLIVRGRYIKKIKEIFRAEGIPEEISSLPHVESSFNTFARSKYGAVGIWQFTRSTGRRYLRINSSVDERKDPYESTRAAAKLFKKSYESLKSWPLAVLAHNYGTQGVRRAVNKIKTKDISVIIEKYKTRRFGFASRNFYPEFIAAVEVDENYEKYFGEIEIEKSLEVETLELKHNNYANSLLNLLNIEKQSFIELNPHISRRIVSYNGIIPKRTTVYLPPEKYLAYKNNNIKSNKINSEPADATVKTEKENLKPKNEIIKSEKVVKVNIDIKPKEPDFSVTTDKNNEDYFYIYVNPEETLWHYSKWSGLSINTIKKTNNIRRSNRLRLHQKINIPLAKSYSIKFEEERKKHHKNIEQEFFEVYKIENLIEHRIRYGENIWEICYYIYGIPFWLVYKYNDAKKLVNVKPGDNIIIPILKK